LRKEHWYHYSGDYRIGTRYLEEAMLDNIKRLAMKLPLLRHLLRSDSIRINNNISVDNLKAVSSFLGKLGNPELGGLGLAEFKRRQQLHHEAEAAAMRDVPGFIQRAREVYGYPCFVNDAGGSLCELDDPSVMETLAEHTLILYIKASEEDVSELLSRAEENPKPLYYREEFLDAQLGSYLKERDLEYAAMIDPDAFARWIFPRLFHYRLPRYEAIARDHGYVISTRELAQLRDERDFLALLGDVLDGGRE
ncbi:MAG: ATPase, partial [Candidatus Eutrophobiaceae bacterium]